MWFNYRTDKIADWTLLHPDKPVICTETASAMRTRGTDQNDPARRLVMCHDTELTFWASTAEL
jgi:hypothetical protein